MTNDAAAWRPRYGEYAFLRTAYLDRRELTWTLGCHDSRESEPTRWVPARVPGGAQRDWADAHGWPDLHYADTWKRYQGLEDRFWTYRAVIHGDEIPRDRGQRVHFVCEGVDYACDVLVDGTVYHHQAGLHTPVDLDITDLIGAQTTLEVRVHPAPKADTRSAWGEEWAKAKRSQANQVTKPSVSYGDDFHPRVIPLGLWQHAYLDVRPATHISRMRTDYRLADDFSSARVWVEGELNLPAAPGTGLRWVVRDGTGDVVATVTGAVDGRRFRLATTIAEPRLWWPHDHGAPHLYTGEVELLDPSGGRLDRQQSTFGVRRLRLVMHDGAWDWPHPTRWPKTRSMPPMTIEVNGRQIFARGGCCVPMSIFFGTVTGQDCDDLVRMAKQANFNMLRISGGCVAFKPEFYDACDRYGVLVWQDFPLACNQYPDDDDYLSLLDAESRAMIGRLRHHPALALWCGGNELFEIHSGMTDQSLALRLLGSNTLELDRDRPFLPSTPLMGMAHGPYEFLNRIDGEEFEGFALTQGARHTAYPEFGCAGPAPVDVLESIIPPEELFPPRPGTAWEDHNAFFAFVEREETWLDVATIERYFGPCKTLEELVERGQLMQGQCLKAIFEEARRKQPMCSLAVMWSFNEPWPNAANLSLLSWPRVAKAGYADVAAACRPVLASARVGKFQWRPGECFEADLWLLSDRPEAVDAGRLEIRLGPPAGPMTLVTTWDFAELGAQENRRGPSIAVTLPRYGSDSFVLSLRVLGRPEFDSEYRYCLDRREG